MGGELLTVIEVDGATWCVTHRSLVGDHNIHGQHCPNWRWSTSPYPCDFRSLYIAETTEGEDAC